MLSVGIGPVENRTTNEAANINMNKYKHLADEMVVFSLKKEIGVEAATQVGTIGRSSRITAVTKSPSLVPRTSASSFVCGTLRSTALLGIHIM